MHEQYLIYLCGVHSDSDRDRDSHLFTDLISPWENHKNIPGMIAARQRCVD